MASNQFSAEPKKSSGGCFLYGCVGVIVLSVALCAGGGIAMYFFKGELLKMGGNFAADQAREVMVKALDELEIEPAERAEVTEQIDRVTNGFKAGQIDLEQVMQIGKNLAEGPIGKVMMMYMVQQKYVKPSGLSADEKQAADVVLQRVTRGVIDGEITPEQLQQVADDLMTTGADGKSSPKDSVTDEELRSFIAKAKALADEKGIPAEVQPVDISDEFRKAIDKVLNQQPAS